MCDECDMAGVWSIDEDAFEFYVGAPLNLDEFMEDVNNGKVRVERFGRDKIFITGFVEFQYGNLSENCKPHQKIISILKKYNLYERVCVPYTKGIDTLQEKDKEQEEEKEEFKEEKGSGEKPKRRSQIMRVSESESVSVQKADYQKILDGLGLEPDTTLAWVSIRDYITDKKPVILEPFADLWNIFSRKHNLEKVDHLTQKRRDKIRSRTREPSFDFVRILAAAKTNDFYMGKSKSDWKMDFDYIIENESNYVKILEKGK